MRKEDKDKAGFSKILKKITGKESMKARNEGKQQMVERF